MPKPTFVVSVSFEVAPEHLDEFKSAVMLQGKNSLTHEESCRQFDVCQDNENPCVFVLYETYDDAAAFDRHTQTPYFKTYFETVSPWIVNKQRRLCSILPLDEVEPSS